MLGFKRRGMLVNHLAKRHPDIKPEDVPELNLPILRTQRDYYCQYCEKVSFTPSLTKLGPKFQILQESVLFMAIFLLWGSIDFVPSLKKGLF